MTAGWIEKLTGSLEEKKRYRDFRARAKALPAGYGSAVLALERYLLRFGAISRGDTLVAMLVDLVELFEESARAGTPVREVVGDDPVEFAETFLANYAEGQWINKERERLIESITRAEAEQAER